ncbi:MAG: DUF983 domain-containing protein [Caulobacteraceae bacterium]
MKADRTELQPVQRLLRTGLSRGARGRCPNCGRGPLLRAYLKVKPTCDACGHELGRYPADDAPPYFTILLVGHLIIAPMLAFPFILTWPTWLLLATLLPALTALTLFFLPIVKGAVIGVLWAIAQPHTVTRDDHDR